MSEDIKQVETDVKETPIPTETAAVTETSTETTATNEDDDNFSWADFSDDGDVETEEATPAVETEKAQNKEWWEIAAEKAGIEATDEDDFVKKIATPKEVYVNERDPEIRKLKAYQAKSDKELVEEQLRQSGMSEDKIERRIKQLESREDLEFEADSIRTQLNAIITQRQKLLDKQEQDNLEYSRNFATTVNKNIEKELSKTDSLLGFKVGKDESDTKKWRDGMAQYIAKNQFAKDIDSILKEAHDGNPQRLLELAQFLRAKDGIVKGLKQIGKSEKANELLGELQNTQTEIPKGERSTEKPTAKGWFTDPAIKAKAGL